MLDVQIESNVEEVKEELKDAITRALERIGDAAVGFAQELCPVDVGTLRGSITKDIVGEEVYIGTNIEYAPYIEFGTGIYAENGGRQTPWSYMDEKGEWHHTNGAQPHPFLRPAATEHGAEYAAIFEDELGKG